MTSRSQDVRYPETTGFLGEVTSYPIFPAPQVPKYQRGEDPKKLFIPYCSLQCYDWKMSYENCEKARTNPNNKKRPSSCLHVWREAYECIEACVQPKVINNLFGANSRYHYWY